MRPIVLTVAGSDSSAGAGIQADLKAIEANGAYAATVLTAVTAQNTRGVLRAEALSPDLVEDQLQAVLSDLDVVAVKTGMLANAAIIRRVARALDRARPASLVCDPVMISKSGAALLPREALVALRESLFPLTDLLTPNVHEAETLCDMKIVSVDDARAAGERLLAQGVRAVLIKGGHLAGRPAADVLVTPRGSRVFEGEMIRTRHTHGTGCTYSAAIAAHLARGAALQDAILRAKQFVTEAIRHGLPLGGGIGPTDPFHALAARGVAQAPPRIGRLHVLTDEIVQDRFTHAELAALAARGGADTIQYREKRPRTTAECVSTAGEIRAALGDGVTFLVNDRADVALAVDADGTHLGREDLAPAAARAILGPARLIGGTANSLEEAIRVAASGVDYLGVGPVFGTRSKARPAPDLGLPQLARIAAGVSVPVIAIGNIDRERIAEVIGCGVHGVALLSSVVCAADPAAATAAIRETLDRVIPEEGGAHAARTG